MVPSLFEPLKFYCISFYCFTVNRWLDVFFNICVQGPKIVSMIRKYHNHKLQTNPWHCKEEPHNNQETPRSQTKQSNQLSLPHQDDFKNSIGHKVMYYKIQNKYRIPEWEQQLTANKLQQNHLLRMDSSLSHWGGLNAFYWYQTFALA